MKSFPVVIYFLQNARTKKNFFFLFKFSLFLVGIISTYAVLFHLLMQYEGREYSWITGFYWALTVMSTLGFGDITFHTDLGLFFTLLVLITGVIFLLILLPFTFVQFFYQPWLEAQQKARTPRQLPETVKNHIIITNLDPVTTNLIKKLEKYHYDYALVEPDINRAQELHEQDYKVVVGDYDDPKTYTGLHLEKAALIVATNDDLTNTSISFTVRELSDTVPIVSNADNEHSIDILEFPGNTYVFEFMKMLGQGIAQRTPGTSTGASIVGNFGQLLIAEVPAVGTPFENKTLSNTQIREKSGLTVVGIWERGRFTTPLPQTVITPSMVLVLAGSQIQLDRYNKLFSVTCSSFGSEAPVLILGGGRVGRTAADTIEKAGIDFAIVEKNPAIVKRHGGKFMHGDAADINTLQKAGIAKARAVLITTHHDAMNIYLTFYCRQLRPDIEIISRAIEERTVSKLYRAGADLVMSAASIGANHILNLLRPNELSMFTEGLNIFSRQVPSTLIGASLIESRIRQKTGCSVISINSRGQQNVSPDPTTLLQEGDELILIGTNEAEAAFLDKF